MMTVDELIEALQKYKAEYPNYCTGVIAGERPTGYVSYVTGIHWLGETDYAELELK